MSQKKVRRVFADRALQIINYYLIKAAEVADNKSWAEAYDYIELFINLHPSEVKSRIRQIIEEREYEAEEDRKAYIKHMKRLVETGQVSEKEVEENADEIYYCTLLKIAYDAIGDIYGDLKILFAKEEVKGRIL